MNLKDSDPRGVEAQPSRTPLISASDLVEILGRPGTKLFDVRGKWGEGSLRQAYSAGHIPSAVFLDWTKELVEQDVPIQLASVAGREAALQSFARLGIDLGDSVVLYDDYHHMLAGRMWWAMRHWGFEDVRVLDGGWRHWIESGLPTSTSAPTPSTVGSFEPQELSGAWRLSLEAFMAESGGACHLDARGAKGFAGKSDDPRSGHIPGAISLPYSELLDASTGCFLERDALIRVLQRVAPEWRDKPLIASCGAGYSATVLMLALSSLDVAPRLFDGSFSVWKQGPSRPVEQSPR